MAESLSVLTEPCHSLDSHTSDINGLSFSKHLMVSCAGDKTVRLWSYPDFNEIRPISPLLGHTLYVNCCSFNPAETLLASCSTDGKLIVWNVRSGEQEGVLEHPSKGGIRVCKFSPNGFYLVSGSDDETLCIWQATSLDLLRCLQGHTTFVVTCAFSPDSKYLVSGCNTGHLRVWDMFEDLGRGLLKDFEAHDMDVMGCDFWSEIVSQETHSKYLLATCGQDGLVKLWEILSDGSKSVQLSCQSVLTGHEAPVSVCCFAHHRKLLASGSFDKTIRLWNPTSGQCIQILNRHTRYVTCCTFSVDDVYLTSGSNDKTIKVWRIATDEPSTEVAISTGDPGSQNVPLNRDPPRVAGAENMVPPFVNTPSVAQLETEPPHRNPPIAAVADNVPLESDALRAGPENISIPENNNNPGESVLSENVPLHRTSHSNPPPGEVAPESVALREDPDGGLSEAEGKSLKDVAKWSVEDTCQWLQRCELGEFSGIFQKHAIDGAELLTLTDEDLNKHLGIDAYGSRSKILKAKQQLTASVPELPDEFLCPITRELMKDPVIASDGYTYERTAIESWLNKGTSRSPMTNILLPTHQLIPNLTVKMMIHNHT
ncbi:WD repeat, SAM and U-box domain-containing protein 1-like [Argonauta hians]